MSTDYASRARASVSAETDPAISAIQRQLQMLAAQKTAQEGAIQQGAAASKASLEDLYSKLAGTQSGIQQTQDQNYARTGEAQGQSYDALSAFLGQNRQTAVDNTSNELRRLGIEEAAPAALQEIQRDGALLQGLAGTEKANAATNNSNQRASFNSLLAGMQANTGAEKAYRQTSNERDTRRSLDSLQGEFGRQNFELSGRLGDLNAQKSSRISLEIQRLIDEAEASQPTYEDELDLAIKKARLDEMLNPRPRGGDDEDDDGLFPTKAFGLGGRGKKKDTSKLKGREDAFNYLRQVSNNPTQEGALMDVFRQLESGNIGNKDRFSFSPNEMLTYDHIRKQITERGWGGGEEDALRQAMNIYFGKG